jgi:hypothetical protein
MAGQSLSVGREYSWPWVLTFDPYSLVALEVFLQWSPEPIHALVEVRWVRGGQGVPECRIPFVLNGIYCRRLWMRKEESRMTRMARISLVICVLVSVILLGGGTFTASADALRKMVVFADGTLLSVQKTVVALSGSTILHTLSLVNALAIQLPNYTDTSAVEALRFLESKVTGLCNPLEGLCVVEGVHDDTKAIVDGGSRCVRIVPAGQEDVFLLHDQNTWNIKRILADAVHPEHQGSGVRVAILDTGIDSSHPDLRRQVAEKYNARSGDSSNTDENGHGTHIAGIIAADLENSLGVVGVAPLATLLAVKVLDRYGAGYLSDLINGLQWVYNNGSPRAKVVNMSIGFENDDILLQKAIQQLYRKAVIMVASAGNRCELPPAQDEGGGEPCPGGPALVCDPDRTAMKYPATYHEVMAVVATDHPDREQDEDTITAYSLSQPEGKVDVAAPGGSKMKGRILSTNKGGGFGYLSGTSLAAAHVAGAAALALELEPKLSFQQLLQCLQGTADGPGRINVVKLVLALLDHSCP